MRCAAGRRTPAISLAATGDGCGLCWRAVWCAACCGSSGTIGRCQSGLTLFLTLATSRSLRCRCSASWAFRRSRSNAGRSTSSVARCLAPNPISFPIPSGLKRMRKHNSRIFLAAMLPCLAMLGTSITMAERASAQVGSAGRDVGSTARPRAREAGVVVGILPAGPRNMISDVAGVMVGQTSVIRGEDVRTGVTAILPHGGNLFREKVPGAVFIGNAFGKLAGSTQVNELGEIETPIMLTSTLNVPRVTDAVIDYMLALPGNEGVQSINPLVGETNDGYLNDIRGRHVGRDEVFAAIKNAHGGAVDEGAVGAGTGTVAFGFKSGIGTSSRKLPTSLGGYTVGVLVQANFGGILTINGAPVGRELGKYYLKEELEPGPTKTASARSRVAPNSADGSVIIVIATDAPIDHRNLQ